MHKFNLKEKTAVITGGAQGFGLDIAKRFINSGAKAIIWDIDEKELIKASIEINSLSLSYYVVDVSNFESVSKTVDKITKNSNALLIDRGDLSRYVPIEKIPMAQENIIKKSKKLNTPTYVATNLLENMIKETQPTRAESHDIYSTLKEGAKGLVLAAETAIGTNPVECVRFLKRCMKVFEKNKKNKIRNAKDYKDYLFQSTP